MKIARSKTLLKLTFIFSVSTLLVFLGACNQYAGRWNATPGGLGQLSAQDAATKLNYAYVKAYILDANDCTSCHSSGQHKGGVVLETLSDIRANSQAIMSDMANKKMPPSGSMSDIDRTVLYAWVSNGAPEGTNTVPLPTPPYPPLSDQDAALKLNYAYVQAKILIPYCIHCHGNDGNVSLDTIDLIKANSQAIIKQVAVSKTMPKSRKPTKMT